MAESGDWYGARVNEVAARYDPAAAESINQWLRDLLPPLPALVLDVGAGSGRDSRWLASLGYEVVAVEPSPAMRGFASRWHSDPAIRYLPDRLPELTKTLGCGISFDFILLNAVWMHVAPKDRQRAFRKLVTLLKPRGVIAVTLRDPVEPDRDMYPVTATEIARLARQHGAFVERESEGGDLLGRDGVRWKQLAVRLPDDGTGALPLIRHVILADSKSSTYKLALLRVLGRIADGSAGWAREGKDDHVDLPLGLVALYWVRLFKPLLVRGLPQTPENRGLEGLGFVRSGFRQLMNVSNLDLRIGMRFSGARSRALHDALRNARDTIMRMPAKYMTYHDGIAIFPCETKPMRRVPADSVLDAPYLWCFGRISVPRHVWQALQRYNVWIEPALVAEWARLMTTYASRQGRKLDEAGLSQAMIWSEPGRETQVAREQALHLMRAGTLRCVWSRQPLTPTNLDIDHCFPWSAWPCSDLWNLLPVIRRVNRHVKRDRLPSGAALLNARDRIVDWWSAGYLCGQDRMLGERFTLEATASLPTLDDPEDPDEVFSAVSLQGLRLSNDQQIPRWDGTDVQSA